MTSVDPFHFILLSSDYSHFSFLYFHSSSSFPSSFIPISPHSSELSTLLSISHWLSLQVGKKGTILDCNRKAGAAAIQYLPTKSAISFPQNPAVFCLTPSSTFLPYPELRPSASIGMSGTSWFILDNKLC